MGIGYIGFGLIEDTVLDDNFFGAPSRIDRVRGSVF